MGESYDRRRRRRVNVSADASIAARGSLAAGLLQLVGRAFGLLFVLGASRVLDPVAFSRYSVVAALVLVGGLLADFGINPTVVREVSRAPGRASAVVAVAVPSSTCLGALVYFALVGFAWAAYPETQAIDVAIGALAVAVGSVCSSLQSALAGAGLLSRQALLAFLQSATTAMTGICALATGLGPRGVAAALVLGAVVALVATVWAVRAAGLWNGGWVWMPKAIRAFLGKTWPLAILGLISAVSLRFDVILLSLLSTKEQTAIYDVSLRAAEAVMSFNTILTGPSLYLFSSRFGAGDHAGTQRAFSETVRLAYLMGLPLSVLVVALHDQLARALFGDAFAGAGPPLAVLFAQVPLALVGYVQGSLLVAGDHHRRGILVAGGVTSVVVVLDIVLIPWLGASGAATAGLATSAVTVLAYARFHRSTTGLITRLPPPKAVIAAAAAGGAAWVLRDAGLPLAITAAGVVYVLLLIGTGAITSTDVHRARAILRAPPPP